MKTTVEIADSLLEEAKATASSRGVPLRQVIEEGLRAVLKQQEKKKRFRLRDGSFGPSRHRESRPWSEIRETIYRGRGE